MRPKTVVDRELLVTTEMTKIKKRIAAKSIERVLKILGGINHWQGLFEKGSEEGWQKPTDLRASVSETTVDIDL